MLTICSTRISDGNSVLDGAEDADGDELTNYTEFQLGTNPLDPDSDHDFLPDGFEVTYGFNPLSIDSNGNSITDANEDEDSDGLINYDEYRSGTNPMLADTDNNSVLDGDEDPDGDGLTNLQEVLVNTHPQIADTNNNGVPDGDEDYDSDGLTNLQEFARGTNPANRDSDGDTLWDGDEVTRGTDPLLSDTDGDGLNDGDEVTRGTNPLVADTDGDGLNDGDEVTRGTNPLVADTDGDGLSDGREVNDENTNPLVVDTDGDGLSDGDEVLIYLTNPREADEDGDGLNDAQEIVLGTNPSNPDSDADGVNDGADNCPINYNPDQVDSDGDGQADACEPGPVSDLTSDTSASKEQATADSVDAIVITVTVRDPDYHVMNNTPVTLTTTDPHLVIEPASGITDNDGVFTAQITTSVITTAVVQIDADGVNLGSVIVSFVGGDPAITVTGLTSVVARQFVVYALDVTNAEPLPSTNVQVVAGLPLGSTIFESEHHPDDTQLLSQGGNQVIWLIPELGANETRHFLVAARTTGNQAMGTQLRFNAQVSGTPDASQSNNTASFTTTVVVSAPPSSVTQTGKLSVAFVATPATAHVGDTVTLQAVVTNTTADETLYNVAAFSPLHGIIQDIPLTSPDSAYPGRLLPGQAAVGSFQYTIPANFAYTNLLWASAADGDPSDGSFIANQAALTQAILDVTGPGVTVTVSVSPTDVGVGDTVHFTVTVANASLRTDSVTNLVVTENLTGSTLVLSPSGAIAPGGSASASFDYPVLLTDVPQVAAWVNVTGQGVNDLSALVNLQARGTANVSATTVPNGANLVATIDPNAEFFLPDTSISLPLNVINSGNQPADNVSIRLTLPPEAELVDVGPGGDGVYDPNTRRITWTRTSLDPNGGTSVSPVIRTSSAPGAQLVFDLTVVSTSPETSYADNVATLTLPVIARSASGSTLITVDRTWIIGDGQDTLQLQLIARDPLGIPMPNVHAVFSANAPGVTFTPAEVVTDANGQAVVAMQTTQSSLVTITAQFDDGAAASVDVQRRPSAIEVTDSAPLEVGVGGTGILNLFVVNTAASSDRFNFSVSGLEALNPAWYHFEPTSVTLGSGQFRNARFVLSVPADQCAVAGTYQATIGATGDVLGSVGEALATIELSPTPPTLGSVLPVPDAHIGSGQVLFSWRSNTPGTSVLYVRAQGETIYQTYAVVPNAQDPSLYTAAVTLPNATYEWYGETTTGCGTTTVGSASAPRTVVVTQSISFDQRTLAFTVGDDYDQTTDINGAAMIVRVRNDDTVSHRVRVDVDNPYPDLILGFTGNGSVNQAATIQPGQSLDLKLRVFTQEITQFEYGITLSLRSDDGITDSVPLTITIHQPQPDIRLTNVVTDPVTLVTTAHLVNLGDTVTSVDLDVVQAGGDISSALPANFIIQPDIHHVYLPTNEGIDIAIIPLEISGSNQPISAPRFDPIRGEYVLTSSRETFDPYNVAMQIPGPFNLRVCFNDNCLQIVGDPGVTNECQADYSATACDGSGIYGLNSQSWYCTNRPFIDVRIRLPFFLTPNIIIDSVHLSSHFSPGGGGIYSHGTQLGINGLPIADGVVPDTTMLEGDVPVSALVDGDQIINVRSQHPYANQAHYVVASDFGLDISVGQYTKVQCELPGTQMVQQGGVPFCASNGVFTSWLVYYQQQNVCMGTSLASDIVNIHEMPDIGSQIIGSLQPQTHVQVNGHYTAANGEVWYQIQTSASPPVIGWVRSDVMSPEGNLLCLNIPPMDPMGHVLVADLDFTKTVDNGLPLANQAINFTLHMSNTGDQALTDIQVVDELPPGLTYALPSGAGITVEPGGNGQILTWVVPTLAPGSDQTLTIPAVAGSATVGQLFVNTASITKTDSNGLVEDVSPGAAVAPSTCVQTIQQPFNVYPTRSASGASTIIAAGTQFGVIGTSITDSTWVRVATVVAGVGTIGWTNALPAVSNCASTTFVDNNGSVIYVPSYTSDQCLAQLVRDADVYNKDQIRNLTNPILDPNAPSEQPITTLPAQSYVVITAIHPNRQYIQVRYGVDKRPGWD